MILTRTTDFRSILLAVSFMGCVEFNSLPHYTRNQHSKSCYILRMCTYTVNTCYFCSHAGRSHSTRPNETSEAVDINTGTTSYICRALKDPGLIQGLVLANGDTDKNCRELRQFTLSTLDSSILHRSFPLTVDSIGYIFCMFIAHFYTLLFHYVTLYVRIRLYVYIQMPSKHSSTSTVYNYTLAYDL